MRAPDHPEIPRKDLPPRDRLLELEPFKGDPDKLARGEEEPPAFARDAKPWGLDVHPLVFFTSAGLILFFVLAVLIGVAFTSQETVESAINLVQKTIAHNAGWFYILVVNLFLAFIVFLLFSKMGKIRLGGKEAKPDFSTLSWFAMLFSAGMGIGLLFFSVAEPMYHLTDPPVGEANTIAAARTAMNLSFFHWGLHAWAIYALVGLALAFFCFNQGLPLTIRSGFAPLLGRKIDGPIGDLIDILAVVATLFGVATSLGLGVQQVNAGLAHLTPIPEGAVVQVILIAIITAMATTSVVLGLDGGIRRFSEFNLGMAGMLLLFVLIAGPTLFILDSLVQNIGSYVQNLPRLSTWTEAYIQGDWQESWTVFYWAWWIAWSPFVGMFIARISKGRTIREFLLGVLFVPALITFVWLTVFGNAAIYEELFGPGGIATVVNENMPVALFVLLEHYPLAILSSIVGIVVVVTFFVTSSDSGSLVIDIITAGGNTDPPVNQRIFWAVTEGVVAAVLLLGGGLVALQTASITTGLPFAIVLLFLCYSLYKGLRQEALVEGIIEPSRAPERRRRVRPTPDKD